MYGLSINIEGQPRQLAQQNSNNEVKSQDKTRIIKYLSYGYVKQAGKAYTKILIQQSLCKVKIVTTCMLYTLCLYLHHDSCSGSVVAECRPVMVHWPLSELWAWECFPVSDPCAQLICFLSAQGSQGRVWSKRIPRLGKISWDGDLISRAPGQMSINLPDQEKNST